MRDFSVTSLSQPPEIIHEIMANRLVTNQFVPLDEAVEKFASRRLRRWAREAKAIEQPRHTDFTALTDPVERMSAAHAYGLGMIEHMRTRNEPTWAMQSELLYRLSLDELEAWGVRVHPGLGDQPERIPSFVFKDRPKVKWAKNSIENVGRKYEVVEVRYPANATEIVRPMVPADRGRPTKAPEIDRLIKDLLGQGVDLRKMSRPRAYQLVRQHAESQVAGSTGYGFSDPVIQRRLVALLGTKR